MANVTGVIEAVKVREVPGKKGMFTSMNYKIGQDWLSIIKNADNSPLLDSLVIGDKVEAIYMTNGNFKNITDLKLIGNAVVPKAVEKATAIDKYANRDFRITYAGSRNTAIAFAKLVLEAGALSLPKKQADMEDSLKGYVDSLTVEFANKAWNAEPGEVVDVSEVKVDGAGNSFEE